MSKCFQYATDDTKVSIGLTSISIKNVNLFYKKPSPGPKKVEKGVKSGRKLVWIWTYIHTNLKTLMKTRFFSKVLLFQETLEFKNIIACCYG